MEEITLLAALSAFAAGAISFLSPCVLPLVPGYVSYVAGDTLSEKPDGTAALVRYRGIGLSVCFVLGFSTVFIILGASATALGQLLQEYRYELAVVGGALVILFGLVLLGLASFTWVMRDIRFHLDIPGGRPFSAYILGLAFAFGWTPCIGPILGSILTLGATNATVGNGILMLAIYSAGLGVPFVVAAIFTDSLMARLKTLKRVGRIVQIVAGIALVLMGLAMITGHLTDFAYWLLDVFPVLGDIG